jgi:iron(III) transport system ATP-binding protein
MTATLEVADLRKQFTIGRPAVDGVSFSVPAGEIVVLLGPSGCGKTTTLRCVAGLEHPTGGEISIGGNVVSSPSASSCRRGCATSAWCSSLMRYGRI